MGVLLLRNKSDLLPSSLSFYDVKYKMGALKLLRPFNFYFMSLFHKIEIFHPFLDFPVFFCLTSEFVF